MTPALGESGHRLAPFFLPTEGGEILVTAWLPREAPVSEWLLVVPPFAEELNKSRRMLAMLGRSAAASGRGALLVDLAGTGDSWGDFRDARYATWLADLMRAARWAEQQGGSVTAIVGLRFGALPGMELTGQLATVRQLLLWQPALSGADVLTQFLRLRTAAGLTGGGEAKETQESLRARLAAGEPVEVAGYDLTPELYGALNGRHLASLLPDRPLSIDWFHLVRQAGAPVPEAIGVAAGTLAARGAAVQTHAVQGDAFWSTAEIAVCDALVAMTVARLAP
ncbi:MAG: hydrolase 2, exosortase A system-associated [Chromatiales bacterium]|nr:hydrolase 2, exosortase A system-associated [Chromatiales bacterium]